MTATRARFFRAFGPGSPFPDSPRREIVFCGRSNVGKSSLLNALTGVRGLARTSKTPGRTREVHFYEEGTDRFLVDLPGYGYAKVSQAERRSWSGLVEGYLEEREQIVLAVLLVDSRHPPFENDLALGDGLASRDIPFIVVLTKADRANRAEFTKALMQCREAFPAAENVILTSAKEGTGIRDIQGIFDLAVRTTSAGR